MWVVAGSNPVLINQCGVDRREKLSKAYFLSQSDVKLKVKVNVYSPDILSMFSGLYNKIHLIRPGCLRPNIATVQNRGLKHQSISGVYIIYPQILELTLSQSHLPGRMQLNFLQL